MGELQTRFPVALWLTAAVLVALCFWKSRDRYVARLVFLLPVLLLIYPLVGNLNLWMLQEEVNLFPGTDPYVANWDVMIGMVGMVAVMAPAALREVQPGPARHFDYNRLNRLTVYGTAIGFIVNGINFAKIGGITILQSGLSGDERFQLMDQMFFARALVISSGFLAINLIALLDRHRWGATRLHLACLPINLLMAAGIGARYLVLLPVLVAFFHTAFAKRVRNRWFIAGMLVLPLLGIAQQVLRGEETYEIVAQSGCEYRDYLALRGDFDFHDFQHGATLLPAVTNAIPSPLFSLVGLDKTQFSSYSAYLTEDLWGAETGIRVGIWGEFFMNWGGLGVILGLVGYGLAGAALDKAMRRRCHDGPAMLNFALLASMMVVAVMGAFGNIGDTLGSYGVLFFLLSRVRKPLGVDVDTRVATVI